MALSLQQWCEQIEQPDLYEKLVALDFSTVKNLLDLPETDVDELVQELGLKFGKKSKFLGGLKDLQASGRNRDVPTSTPSTATIPPRSPIPNSYPQPNATPPSKPNTNSYASSSSQGSASSQGGKYDTVIARMKADAHSIQSYEIPLELVNPKMDVHQCVMHALGSLWQSSAYQQLYQSIMAHAHSNAEIQNLLRSNNVTMDALLSLVYFTSDIRPYGGVEEESIFRLVNKALYSRDSGSLKSWLPFLFHAFEAYRNLPKYSGTLYRGITKKVLEETQIYKPGSEIVWIAFTSTSKSTDVMRSFSGDSGTWFVLECEGIDLSFSMFPRESEILLFPNTRLKVTGLLTEEMRRLSNFPENFNVVQLSHVQRPQFAAPLPVKSKSSSKPKSSKSSSSSKKEKDKSSSSKRKAESGAAGGGSGAVNKGASIGTIGVNGPNNNNVNAAMGSNKIEALEKEALEIQKALEIEKQKKKTWDALHCSSTISITGGCKVTKLGTAGWANVLGLYPGSYKCRIDNIGDNYMMIGLASRNTKPDGENSEVCGYYVYTSDASLWSERPQDRRRPYGEPKKAKKMESGSIVEVLLENGNTTIRYIINGTDCGIAFEKLDPRVALYPSIDLYNVNCAVTLI